MFVRALSADFLKIRGKGIWFLVFLGPVGLVVMQSLNYGLRYDYLMKRHASDLWGGLIENVSAFVPIALYLGMTLVCSLIAGVEHQTSAWKQLLALPISRSAVFAAKLTISIVLLAASCLLLSIGTVILGFILGFGAAPPFGEMLRMSFVPFVAAMPMLTLAMWLTVTIKNQGVPVSIGVAAALVSPFVSTMSVLIPLNWPALAFHGPLHWQMMAAGASLAVAIGLIGWFHFTRKDVE
ncbi:permease [Paenibacillus mesophilus]|uniref:ABC transporter permease n=1 Tax=Paenibacillus mesophilus TaxID=2582849 RepID=UPI00110DA99D|nr:ABC transporter permease [Paenibacillus mesophilus]TMV52250.1 permease [Paenibacillus mesophilus]